MERRTKDPMRQITNRRARADGKRFEERLDAAFLQLRARGSAMVEKTPEPMRATKSLGNGRFIAYFERKAQPDYKGTLKGGRAVLLEAKYTSADRITTDRVTREQSEYLDLHERLGAACYVVCGFRSGEVYTVPWFVWRDAKDHFGHKYVTEADLERYRVPADRSGTLLVLG